MKKRCLALILALTMLLPCGCAVQKIAAAGREFTDDAGRTVSLPEEITSILPSGALAQMVLLALAPDMLAGLASRWPESAEGIVPEAVLKLPYYGQLYQSGDLNAEAAAKSGAALFLDMGEGKVSLGDDLDDFTRKTGIPAVHFEASLAAMPEVFVRMGTLLGREEKAAELAQFCRRVYDRAEKIMAQVGENRVRALYLGGEDGLSVLGKGAYHAEVFDFLTENVAELDAPSSRGTGNVVTIDQILLWNPDFLVFAPGDFSRIVGEDAIWREIPAVAAGRYVQTPAGPYGWLGSPPSVQRFLGLIWLPSVLYPDVCGYDAEEEITEFYRLFYGCELTKAQYDALTAGAFLR